MYFDFRVKLPDSGKVNVHNEKGVGYVYYTFDRTYSTKRKNNTPKRKGIGKVCADDPSMIYPNEAFFDYFPDVEIPGKPAEAQQRSNSLSVGAYLILKKLVTDYELDTILQQVIGDEAPLFLDLALFSIITEDNQAQRYPFYTFDHPLLTPNMYRYEDPAISKFLRTINVDHRNLFLKLWNDRFPKETMVYMSFDSTNKYYVGDISFAEFSARPKQGLDKPVINYATAYDHNNRIPLFYDEYSGSIVDVSILTTMVDTAKKYGYKKACFIIDRGFFSKSNFDYIYENGYDFIAMVKGHNQYVKKHIADVKGTFEDKHSNYIPKHRVYGTTIEGYLFSSDNGDKKTNERKKYFHIYHDFDKEGFERARINDVVEKMRVQIEKLIRKGSTDIGTGYDKYFWLYYEDNDKDEKTYEGQVPRGETRGKLLRYQIRHDVINSECSMAGYFVIITSENMSAEKAINLYRSRDALEKLFRTDKSFLGFNALRIHDEEALDGKLLIEFVALILREKLYTSLKDRNEEFDSLKNYMSVPAAIGHLEMIQISKKADGVYRLDHEPTKRQKDILSAFGVDTTWLKQECVKLQPLIKAAQLGR